MVTGVVPHVGGPILAPGAPTVLIGMLPAARMTDMAICVGPPDMIMMGSPTVLIQGLMAARIGDPTVHGGVIVMGFPMVEIGEVGMGSPAAVVVAPLAGGGGGGGGPTGTAAGGPAETGADAITAGQGRTDSSTTGQLVVAGHAAVMQTAARAMNSAPAEALAQSSENGTPFIEPCPG